MIIVPNKNIIVPKDPVTSVMGVQGWYKMEALKVDADGNVIEKSRRLVADWFPNLITNQGLDRLGGGNNGNIFPSCQVGSGNTAPNVNDTGLVSRIAGTSSSGAATVTGAQSTPPYYGWLRNVYRFSTGTAAGNLSEVGVGWGTTGSTLYSRALVLDLSGNPTTVTVLSDEVLDVTYEHRLYPPTSDATNVVNISGVDYTFTTRAANVTTASNWSMGSNNTPNGGCSLGLTPSPSAVTAYNGTIGAVTAIPGGSSEGFGSSPTLAAYTPGNYYRDSTVSAGTSVAVLSGGISALLAVYGRGFPSSGVFQYGISPAIPKTNLQTLTLTFSQSWARKTIP